MKYRIKTFDRITNEKLPFESIQAVIKKLPRLQKIELELESCAHLKTEDVIRLITTDFKQITDLSMESLLEGRDAKDAIKIIKSLPKHVTTLRLDNVFTVISPELSTAEKIEFIEAISDKVTDISFMRNDLGTLDSNEIIDIINAFSPNVTRLDLKENNFHALSKDEYLSVLDAFSPNIKHLGLSFNVGAEDDQEGFDNNELIELLQNLPPKVDSLNVYIEEFMLCENIYALIDVMKAIPPEVTHFKLSNDFSGTKLPANLPPAAVINAVPPSVNLLDLSHFNWESLDSMISALEYAIPTHISRLILDDSQLNTVGFDDLIYALDGIADTVTYISLKNNNLFLGKTKTEREKLLKKMFANHPAERLDIDENGENHIIRAAPSIKHLIKEGMVSEDVGNHIATFLGANTNTFFNRFRDKPKDSATANKDSSLGKGMEDNPNIEKTPKPGP
ncbi:MAG: hypothetical protein Q8M40_01480 [Legionella sp.]|nr:hypothetical protein [Legionella sp.]